MFCNDSLKFLNGRNAGSTLNTTPVKTLRLFSPPLRSIPGPASGIVYA